MSSYNELFYYYRKIRANVVSFACLRGVTECIDKAKERYSSWMDDESYNP